MSQGAQVPGKCGVARVCSRIQALCVLVLDTHAGSAILSNRRVPIRWWFAIDKHPRNGCPVGTAVKRTRMWTLNRNGRGNRLEIQSESLSKTSAGRYGALRAPVGSVVEEGVKI